MRYASPALPDLVPVLSRGKHRNPRKGACFMEMASYLAGERWSDHPRCTHPLLASVARLVNDHTSDEHRSRLVGLIPSVIGLTTDDPRADARIALRCAIAALPIVAADHQKAMAVSVLAAERALARGDGRPEGDLGADSVEALDSAPLAARWAASFAVNVPVSLRDFRRFGAPGTVRVAIPAIAEACVSDPNQRLYDVLAASIDEISVFCEREGPDHRTARPLSTPSAV